MFCENCGNKIEANHKYCMRCGHSNAHEMPTKSHLANNHIDQKWWLRLAKVVYIGLYLPLPFVLIAVWSENSSSYNYYTRTYTDTLGEAFWYSLLTLVIWVLVLRLIKITFLYISLAQKPKWKNEFKKFF